MGQGYDQWNAYGDWKGEGQIRWQPSYVGEVDGVGWALGMWAVFIVAAFLICVGIVYVATAF
jgi:hypothetical protein